MGKKNQIGAYITLDGAKTFQADVTSCNKELKSLQSELKLVGAQNIGNANSIEALNEKQEVLTKILEKQQEKLQKSKAGLAHLEKEYQNTEKVLLEHKKTLEVARQELENMTKETNASEEAIEKQRLEVEKEEDAVAILEEAYRKAGDRISDWKTKVNTATAQVIKASSAVNENAIYVKDAEKSVTGHTDKLDEFGEKTDDIVEKLTDLKTVLVAKVNSTIIDAGAKAIKYLYDTAVEGAIELQDAQAQLQASTGATLAETEKYSKEMRDLYSEGYAESIDEVAQAMELVRQYTKETDSGRIKELAENGMVLEDVFGIGLSESIRAADVLIEEMGLDAQGAFDLLSKGAQNGLNKSGELAENIAEYGPLWAQAGFSAEEMFSIMQNGLDSGAYNLDKVNDYVKEFGNSLADGRIETHLSSFSSDTQQLFADWKAGNASTKQVFQSVIKDLSQMENKQKALTIASDTWSATGEDNSMKVLTSLNDINDMYTHVQGTMEDIKNIKYDTLSNEMKQLSRKFQQDVGAPIIQKALPVAEKIIDGIGDNIELVTGVLVTFGTVAGTAFAVKKAQEFGATIQTIGTWIGTLTGLTAKKVVVDTTATTVTGANTVATVTQTGAVVAQTVATEGATVAQTGLNAAMSSNPIGLVLTGVALLTTAIIACASATEDATTEIGQFCEESKELTNEMKDADKALQETFGNIQDCISEFDAREVLSNNLVSELFELDSQAQKTQAQISRMSLIVDELNSIFPELSLSVDKNTGALSKNEQQVKKTIATSLDYAKAQAVQEQMAEVVKKMTEAEIKQTEAYNNIEETKDKLEAINAKVNEEYKKYQKNLDKMDYHLAATKFSNATDELRSQQERLTGTLAEQEETYDTLQKTIDEANEEYAKAQEYLDGLNNAKAAGTDELKDNTNATNDNIDAKKTQNEETRSSIEVAGQEKDAYDALSASKRSMAVEVTNAVLTMQEQVTGVLESQMNLFEEFDKGTAISKDKLLANMQSQITGIEDWEKNLSELAEKGINEGILQELMEMGPEGSAYVEAFNSMSASELKKAEKLWKKSLNIQNMTNDWGQQLLESGAANVAGGVKNLNSLMKDAGAYTVAGLVQGMQAAQTSAEIAGTDLGVKTIDAIDDGLGCASPSKKAKVSGTNTGDGLVLGLQASYVAVENSGYGMGTAVITGIKNGIEEGEADILASLSKVCDSAMLAAVQHFKVDYSGVNGSSGGTGILSDSDYSLMKQAWTDAAKQMVFKVYLGEREVSRQLSKMGVVFNA